LKEWSETIREAWMLWRRPPQTAEDGVKIQEALKSVSGSPEGQQMLALAEKYNLKTVGQAKKLASELEKIGFDKVFPKLAEMKSANLINGGTVSPELPTWAPMCSRSWFAAPSLTRPCRRTRRTVDSCGIEGSHESLADHRRTQHHRPSQRRCRSTKDGTVATWKAVSTKEGWTMMRTSVGETLAPLGTKNFYTKSIPGAAYDASAWGLTKLNSGRKVITDRLALTAINPATATPEVLATSSISPWILW